MRLHNILIYDAECRLCTVSKQWIERWDRRHRITFLPFQDKMAKEFVPELASMSCMDAMRFVDREGRVFLGVSAFRAMLPLLPMGGIIALFFYLPGFSRMAHRVYWRVARNRYRWFGTSRIS